MFKTGPTVALIVAAGRGRRASDAGSGPKQYAALGASCVLAEAMRPFLSSPLVHHVLVVIHRDDTTDYAAAVAGLDHAKLLDAATGGATRQHSVRAGLDAVSGMSPARVLIHDAARPFLTADTIERVVAALAANPAAIPAVPLADTLKRAGPNGTVAATVDRAGLWRAQTPQGFRYSDIVAAHAAAAAAGRFDFTDDAAIAEWCGLAVQIVPGTISNIKLTTAEDMRMAQAAHMPAHLPDIRTGQGFDVHRFMPGDHVWLCGVRVPHSHGVEAHSDGDVGLHALTDALLGAIADGDIGQHFKNTDPRWRGASSDNFLADAVRRVTERGGRISNVDVTVLCEAPKIGPHRDVMRARMAEILGLPVDRVALKATTTEQLGFAGRREGLAAMALATVVMART